MSSSRPPHIVVASNGLGHVARGVETWAAELARALDSRGVRVTLCKGAGDVRTPYERAIPCWPRASRRAMRAARLLPRALAWRMGLESPYGVEQATFALGLIAHLRRTRADVLHVQDPLVASIVQRARRWGLVRTRVILAHGTEETSSFLNSLEHVQHLAPAHADTCLSEGFWRERWTTIPNFVDTEAFTPGVNPALRAELGIPDGALVVLTVAAIKRKHKRIDALIDEFAALLGSRPELPAYLVIAGGWERDTDQLVEEGTRRLGNRVRFLVRFPRDRMAALYQAADVFVLASLKEMMPLAILEACASGLPCIVNDDPVLSWMTGQGGDATPMASPGALASAMDRLLTDPKRMRMMGSAARENCVQRFSEETVIGQVARYYSHLTRRPLTLHPPRSRHTTDTRESQTHPRVSVVIPAFNCGWCIGQAIESVLRQTRPADEIIVIDDGSTDDTWTRLGPYMSRIRYERSANAGVAAARNRAIELATGDLLAFLDADDVWHPRKLERQLRVLADRRDVLLLGTATFSYPCGAVPEAADGAVSEISWRQLAVRNRLTTSSVVVHRSAVIEAGGFDPALHGPEDYDLWLRIARRGRIALLRAPLVGYRIVEGSLSQRPRTMEAGLLRIIAKLDRERAWGSGWLLRRRARASIACSMAQLNSAAGDGPASVRKLIESLRWYPLPMARSDVRCTWMRARILFAGLRKCLMGRATRADRNRVYSPAVQPTPAQSHRSERRAA